MSSGSLSAAAFSSTTDDAHPLLVAVSVQDRKDQALFALKSELMAKLDKEVKSLDNDSWMFDGPRSHINLISRPGMVVLAHAPPPSCTINDECMAFCATRSGTTPVCFYGFCQCFSK